MIGYQKSRALTAEEELELIALAQGGDVAARNELVMAHLPFVKLWAKQQSSPPWMTMDDRISIAVLGLIRAIEKYDPKKGARLLTYAKLWFRAKYVAALENGHLVHVPNYVVTRMKTPGALKEHIARAALIWTGGLRTLPGERFDELSRRWWAERYPEEVPNQKD